MSTTLLYSLLRMSTVGSPNLTFNSLLFWNVMIFYLNLFKAIKFALKVINMNRPAPNLQLGLGTNYDVESCTQQYFLSSPGTNSAK